MKWRLLGGLFVASVTTACVGDIGASSDVSPGPGGDSALDDGMNVGGSSGSAGSGGSQPVRLAAARLSRLTTAQYKNAVRDLFGASIAVPVTEPDDEEDGYTSIGAVKTPLSARGVEQYDAAALIIAHQAFLGAQKRESLLGCAPSSAADACIRTFIEKFGRTAWRRPLESIEVDQFVRLTTTVATTFADVWIGLEYMVAALLQSPYFVYRVELGEPDPSSPTRRRYTAHEMATRLSFVLTQSIPDTLLLDAAQGTQLLTADGVRAQAVRLLGTDRARDAVMRFFREYLGLERLDNLVKDARTFPRASATLGPAMRGEIERAMASLVFDRKGSDFRNVLDTHSTFVNTELAKLYGVAPPSGSTFAPVELPVAGQRGGLLGFAGFLAMNAHATIGSPTLRGKFIQEHLLCQTVPLPGADVNTTLPQASASQRTLRQRLEEHRKNPECIACHAFTDPIGFGLEHFDGIGAYRDTENGAAIDATGQLDGKAFDGALELAGLLKTNEKFATCVVRQLYSHSVGHRDADGEQGLITALAERFRRSAFRFSDLVVEVLASDGFRYAAVN